MLLSPYPPGIGQLNSRDIKMDRELMTSSPTRPDGGAGERVNIVMQMANG